MADVAMDDAAAAPPAALPLAVPAEVDLGALQSVLSDAVTPLSLERLAQPDEALVLAVYKALLKSTSELEAQRQARERADVDAEGALHTAQNAAKEAQERAARLEQEVTGAKEAVAPLEREVTALKSENEQLKATQGAGAVTSKETSDRLQSIEEEKRGLLDMLDREKVDSSRKSGESCSAPARA